MLSLFKGTFQCDFVVPMVRYELVPCKGIGKFAQETPMLDLFCGWCFTDSIWWEITIKTSFGELDEIGVFQNKRI